MQYELLTIREVAQMLRVNVSTVYRLVREGEVPSPIRIGPTSTRWRADELRAWLDSRPHSVSANGPAQAA